MAALSASRLVCSAMPVMVSTMPPICSDLVARPSIAVPTWALELATSRIASVACAAARTPSSATLAGLLGGLGGGGRGLGAGAGGAGGLLDGLAGGLDHAHLALGALRDVGDRGGDLADGAAGLLGGRRHLLRGRGDGAGALGDLGEHAAELRAHRVVGVDRVLGLAEHLVEGGRQPAELVGAVDLDRAS